ncbi:MAG TPA: hypothetical protein VFA29_12405, partial [Candidatus Baltobacteraceae bacterium]|nr:hypothetical protein [Candidatus Baltobacteraceae bacterium]
MGEYLHWFSAPFDSFYVYSGIRAFVELAQSSNLLFWYLILVFIRYQLPDLALWVGYVLQPRNFEPPALRKFAGAKPLVSFIIAGRNPGYSIVTC